MDIQQAKQWLYDPEQHFRGLALLSAIVRHDPDNVEAAECLIKTMKEEEFWWPVQSFDGRCEFSSCGKRLSITSDGMAQVWNVHTGQPITKPWRIWTHALPDRMWHQSFRLPQTAHLCHQGDASVCFSPDGKLIASAGEDGTVRLWDAQTGAAVGQPMVFYESKISARFNQDGSKVVVVYMNGSAQVLDPLSGQALTKVLTHDSPIQSAEFSPDGQLLLTSGADGKVCVWRLPSGEPDREPLCHDLSVRFSRFSSDGLRVLTVMFNVGATWDISTRRPLPNLLVHEAAITCVEFSPDGKFVATGSVDGETGLWDNSTGTLFATIPKHPGRITALQFSPEGDCVMICSVGGLLRIIRVQAGECCGKTLEIGGAEVVARFSRDGSRIVTGNSLGIARIWDALSLDPQTAEMSHVSYNHGYQVSWVDFSPDGQRVVTACADCCIRIWNSLSGELIQKISIQSSAASFVRFTPDARRIMAIVSHADARIYDISSGQVLSCSLGGHLEWPHVEFCANGDRLLSGENRYGTQRLWDVHTQKPLTDMIKNLPVPSKPYPGEMVRTCAALSPDGRHMVTGSMDGMVRVWELQAGKEILPPMPMGSDVVSVKYSPDGQRIVATCHGNAARIWAANTGKTLSDWLEHENEVSEACYSGDGKILATVSSAQVRIWDGYTGRSLMPPLWVYDVDESLDRGLALNEDGSMLLTISYSHGILRVWDLATAKPIGQPIYLKKGGPFARFLTSEILITGNDHDGSTCIWQKRDGIQGNMPAGIEATANPHPSTTDMSENILSCIHDLVELLARGRFDSDEKWQSLDAERQIELIKKVEQGLRNGVLTTNNT